MWDFSMGSDGERVEPRAAQQHLTTLAFAQAAFGEWDAILAAPAPPPTARDNCAGPGGYQMAQAVCT